MKKAALLSAFFPVLVMLCGISEASGQEVRPSERESRLDSMANPTLSPSGAYMKFESKVIDAGVIKETDQAPQYVFEWTNVGEEPITVLMVTTTCSCASPTYERVPVAPGEKSSLTITYHPKGFPGKFERRIFVYTDLSGKSPAAVLSLKGSVESPKVPVWAYRHQMGPLYLRRTEVKFSPGQKAVERIACLNAGDKPLTLGVEAELLPPYISFRCEPETIAAGEEANIYISYDPGAAPMRLLNTVPLILKGIDLAPSQRTVKLIFENKKL